MSHPIKTQWIDLAPGFAGYLALPPAGRGPGLVLFQEIFGVNEYIRDVCRRFAHAGYLAVAPELYFRQGDPAALENVQDIIGRIVSHARSSSCDGLCVAAPIGSGWREPFGVPWPNGPPHEGPTGPYRVPFGVPWRTSPCGRPCASTQRMSIPITMADIPVGSHGRGVAVGAQWAVQAVRCGGADA